MMRVKKISAMIITVIIMVSMVPAMVFAAKKDGGSSQVLTGTSMRMVRW